MQLIDGSPAVEKDGRLYCQDCGGGQVTIPVREDTQALIESLGGNVAVEHHNPCPNVDWEG
jgi:uncharacterized Zn finger protein (UPF0148 family)